MTNVADIQEVQLTAPGEFDRLIEKVETKPVYTGINWVVAQAQRAAGYDVDSMYSPTRTFRYHTDGGKDVVMKDEMLSDGATWAKDIPSFGWIVHDQLTDTGRFADNTECSNYEASNILSEVLTKEGRYVRAWTWWAATAVYGRNRKFPKPESGADTVTAL